MTKDDIICMARKAGLIAGADMTTERNVLYLVALTNFAALVAAAEREACAKIADEWQNAIHDPRYECDSA